jgi:hypothetical protein
MLARTYREVFLAHQPAHQGRMTGPGVDRKFINVHHPITDRELDAHFIGQLTLAAPLIGPDDVAYIAAIDSDADAGESTLWRLLLAAQARGFTAFAITSRTEEHDGGHVWFLFDQPTHPDRLRQFAQAFVTALGLAAETYPTRKTLRLPLGMHRRAGRRGTLLLPTGATLDLDVGGDVLAEALAAITALPRNATTQLPHLPPPTPRPRSTRPHVAPTTDSISEAYNQATDLVALLERYGGRIAQRGRSKRTLLHCPCPHHAHGDARPSVEIQPARKARYGQHVVIGHAPGCQFATERGQVMDAFRVFCTWEGLTPQEAALRLRDEQEVH